MRVQVHKTGRHDAARRLQNTLGGLPFQAANLGDFAVLDRYVAHIAWRARPINDRAAFDKNVKIRHRYLRHDRYSRIRVSAESSSRFWAAGATRGPMTDTAGSEMR